MTWPASCHARTAGPGSVPVVVFVVIIVAIVVVVLVFVGIRGRYDIADGVELVLQLLVLPLEIRDFSFSSASFRLCIITVSFGLD